MFSSLADGEHVFIVEGRAAVYASFFWLLMAAWLHTLNYWSEDARFEKFAPIVSNLALIASLVFGCMAVFTDPP